MIAYAYLRRYQDVADVVIVDVVIPGRSGWTTTRRRWCSPCTGTWPTIPSGRRRAGRSSPSEPGGRWRRRRSAAGTQPHVSL